MGRIKEITRKEKGKKRNPVVYIICEGTETEIKYFKRYRTRGCHIDIVPIPSQYKAADSLVKKAKATLGNNSYYPEDGDSLWCVFDRDDNTDDMLKTAKAIALKENYHLVFSNPSFEIWFLLHFIDQQGALDDCNAVIRLLKQPGRLAQYAKNIDVFHILEPLRKQAIERADNRSNRLKQDHMDAFTRSSNPFTNVSELVKHLLKNS